MKPTTSRDNLEVSLDDMFGEAPPLAGTQHLPGDFLSPGAVVPPKDPPDAFRENLPASVPTHLTTVSRRGQPLSIKRVAMTRDEIEQMLVAVVSLPPADLVYGVNKISGELEPIPPENATLIEKAAFMMGIKAANGDNDMAKYLFDRILGRPRQQVESVHATMTYEDYLKVMTGHAHDDATDESDADTL